MRKGVCCIVLSLTEQDNPIKFNTMTYARFSAMSRSEALSTPVSYTHLTLPTILLV